MLTVLRKLPNWVIVTALATAGLVISILTI